MGLVKPPFVPCKTKSEQRKEAKAATVKGTKPEEYGFLSPYYPIPCTENSPIHFYFTPLNILTPKEFDSVLKISDLGPLNPADKDYNDTITRFSIFRSIFVKEDTSVFPEKLLTYQTEKQTKLNTFNYVVFNHGRDKSYRKESKSINFITGCKLDSTGTGVVLINLPFDKLTKQIKDKTLVNKVYDSKRYGNYLETLQSQYNTNKDKIIPLQVGKIVPETFDVTTIAQLKDYFIPNCKAHKIGELIHTVKTSMSVKEFKKSKNYGRVFELRGEAIRYFYNEKNYTELGKERGSVLFNSCMRHNSCFEQLKFYSNNPQSIALLVVMDKDNPRQIVARTILWTDVSGKKAVDRIYNSKHEDAGIIVTYCKSVGYKTIHDGTVYQYGLEGAGDFIVHIENTEETGLPYFDTMNTWERINSFLSTSSRYLKEYCEKQKLDFIVSGNDMYSSRKVYSIRGNSNPDYIRDVYGKPISDKNKVVAIDLPKVGFLEGNRVDLIGYPKRNVLRISKQFKKSLKTKYNCIADSLCRFNSENYVKYEDDKKNLVYSVILKSYIDKKDSYYNYNLNSFIYKDSKDDSIVRNAFRLKKLKSLYSQRIVSVSKEGYEYLKRLNENLIVPFSTVKIRPSRKFRIQSNNVLFNGVLIKDMIIPFKYLKTVKSNGQNKK